MSAPNRVTCHDGTARRRESRAVTARLRRPRRSAARRRSGRRGRPRPPRRGRPGRHRRADRPVAATDDPAVADDLAGRRRRRGPPGPGARRGSGVAVGGQRRWRRPRRLQPGGSGPAGAGCGPCRVGAFAPRSASQASSKPATSVPDGGPEGLVVRDAVGVAADERHERRRRPSRGRGSPPPRRSPRRPGRSARRSSGTGRQAPRSGISAPVGTGRPRPTPGRRGEALARGTSRRPR